jgi:hypothetical protein
MRLQDIANIKVPVQVTHKLQEELMPCSFEISFSPETNPLREKIGNPYSTQCMAWLNTETPGEHLVTIKITNILNWREVTNGVENLLYVAKAELVTMISKHSHPVILKKSIIVKLRQLTKTYPKLTEEEGQHAVSTNSNQDIKYLFPVLYCIGHVKDTHSGTWEFIGMEELDEVAPSLSKTTVADYYEAALCIARLHKCGYVHGDCHMGNFMRVPQHSDHPVPFKGRIIMIDQDCLRPFPDDAKLYSNVIKYLIIQDFNNLLYWNNIFVRFYHKLPETETAIAAYQMYLHTKKMSYLLPPWKHGDLREMPYDQMNQMFKKKQYERYIAFLESITFNDIYQFYNEIFQSERLMRQIDPILTTLYYDRAKKVKQPDARPIPRTNVPVPDDTVKRVDQENSPPLPKPRNYQQKKAIQQGTPPRQKFNLPVPELT